MKEFRTYSFYTRGESPCLYLRLNLGQANSKKAFSTGLRLDGVRFDEQKQRFTGSDERVDYKNHILSQIVTAITTHKGNNQKLVKVVQAIGSEKAVSSSSINETTSFTLLDALEENFKAKLTRKRGKLSASRIRGIKSTISSLMGFLDSDNLDLEIYNLHDFEDKKDRQQKLSYINDYFYRLQSWFVQKDFSPRTQNQYLSYVRESVEFACSRYGYLIPCNFESIYVAEQEPISMPPEDAYLFLNSPVEFDTDEMNYVFAVAKLQILVPSLRNADALSIREKHFELLPGTNIVQVKRLTTKAKKMGMSYIPLSLYEKLKEFDFKPPFKELKKSSHNEKFNRILRDVLTFFPEIYNQRLSVVKQNPDGSVYEEETKLGDVFTSHNLVKTGVNYWEYTLQKSGVVNLDKVMDMISAKTKKVRDKHYSNPRLNTDMTTVSSIVSDMMGGS